MTGRSRIHPTSAERIGVRGDSPCSPRLSAAGDAPSTHCLSCSRPSMPSGLISYPGTVRLCQARCRVYCVGEGKNMSNGDLGWITNFIWRIADEVLRDLYVRGKYRDVILPMMVLRRLDAILEPTKKAVIGMKASLDAKKIVQHLPSQQFCSGGSADEGNQRKEGHNGYTC